MTGDTGGARPPVATGSWVEVRSRFNGRWAAGFVVEASKTRATASGASETAS
jgi:hypothetical protein